MGRASADSERWGLQRRTIIEMQKRASPGAAGVDLFSATSLSCGQTFGGAVAFEVPSRALPFREKASVGPSMAGQLFNVEQSA